jgi:hypothetical protein
MEKCPVCLDGRVMAKLSSAGAEKFCLDCRRIVASAMFDFKFSAKAEDEIQSCTTANNQPGWKGPGEKAKCWPYEEGKSDSEAAAKKKALDSAYAYKHNKGASKIVHAVGYFTGAEPLTGTTSSSGPLGVGPQSNPVAPTSHLGKSPEQTGPLRSGGSGANGEVPAAPGGVQPGELNGANPLNSGTTASRITPRLAELIREATDTPTLINEEIMGTAHCTKCNKPKTECGCN